MTRIVITKTEEEWLELRKTVITATESSSLLGLNPWASANKMWKEKQNSTFSGNAYTVIGNWLEPIVVEAANMMLGTDFKLIEQTKNEKVFYFHDKVRLGATPDADDGTQFLECKTTKPANYLKYDVEPPMYYIAQLIQQLHCAGRKTGYLAIMSTDLSQESPELLLPICIYKVKCCPGICKLLDKEVKRFWTTVEKGDIFRVDSKVKNKAQLLIRLAYEKVV